MHEYVQSLKILAQQAVLVWAHANRCGLAGTLLITAVEAALRIPQQLPTSKPLRARFISFLHRMVSRLTIVTHLQA